MSKHKHKTIASGIVGGSVGGSSSVDQPDQYCDCSLCVAWRKANKLPKLDTLLDTLTERNEQNDGDIFDWSKFFDGDSQ